MNRLSLEKRAAIVTALIEGNSVRATARMAGVSKDTARKLQVEAGEMCEAYQDRVFRNLTCRRIQCDEIWSFCYAKAKNVTPEIAEKIAGAGDVWTWVAIDADTKLIPCWLVAGRGAEAAYSFMQHLASRLASRVQITTDGHRAYLNAVEDAFSAGVDYAMLVKIYGSDATDTRYSPPECISCRPQAITGNPDPRHISTSMVERQNLSMRMRIRRFTRLTNAFSKKVENHIASVALYFMHYNFCRVHQTLRVTPCMEAGITDHVWSVEEMLTAIEKPN